MTDRSDRERELEDALRAYRSRYPCPGFEVEPGVVSGCDGRGIDCPTHAVVATLDEPRPWSPFVVPEGDCRQCFGTGTSQASGHDGDQPCKFCSGTGKSA